MRLFWKILLGYFLAWTLLSLALLGTLGLDSRARLLPRSAISRAIPSNVGVQMTATNLELGGEAMVPRLEERRLSGQEPPLVVDEEGRDVLGRLVDPEVLTLARSLAVENEGPNPVRSVVSLEGTRFIVYYPEGDGPADRTPLRLLLTHPWLLGVVFSVAGVLLAFGLTTAWTRPIAGLHAAFDALGEGKQSRVDPRITRRGDELGDLARDFEEMAQRLSRSIQTQKQLLHDVSHELRSPLARLSVAADLAKRRPDRRNEALERIERDCERLDRLVGELLTLARLEAETPAELDDYFDLLELLRSVREDVAFEAGAAGVEVTLTVPDCDELVLHGNAELLRRAIENVVRNALQHSQPNGRIDTRLEHAADEVRLAVSDEGSGLQEAQLESLFEPFARGASSGGFGLGLAIARRAVLVHGGSISARNLESGGAQIEIVLPGDRVRLLNSDSAST
ncbi:MAG: HAMP domain-containing sensor histidine kinase [Acidobacteriota bacterium]